VPELKLAKQYQPLDNSRISPVQLLQQVFILTMKHITLYHLLHFHPKTSALTDGTYHGLSVEESSVGHH